MRRKGAQAQSVPGPTYGHGQREVWYGTVQQAEAAARDFQQRGYRRRTRSLVPGDVLVAESAGGFSVFWITKDAAAPRSPRRRKRAPLPVSPSPARGEGPGEAGSGVPAR
jgi:hypothetical protein